MKRVNKENRLTLAVAIVEQLDFACERLPDVETIGRILFVILFEILLDAIVWICEEHSTALFVYDDIVEARKGLSLEAVELHSCSHIFVGERDEGGLDAAIALGTLAVPALLAQEHLAVKVGSAPVGHGQAPRHIIFVDNCQGRLDALGVQCVEVDADYIDLLRIRFAGHAVRGKVDAAACGEVDACFMEQRTALGISVQETDQGRWAFTRVVSHLAVKQEY